MPQVKTHLAIIVPVYNEGKVIRKVINTLPKRLAGVGKISVIAVDDGSSDNSEEEISKTEAVLIPHPINLGAGTATVTGIEAAKKINADIIVTFDGDGQHDPGDIGKLIKPIQEKKADLVIGTRLKNPKGMPKIKRVGNWGLNFITFLLSKRWTSDSQSGFKALSRKATELINIDAIGYEFCSQIIIESSRMKLKVKEVPVKVIYTKYSNRKGQSILNGINILWKLIFKKVTG